jgi:hypothetical protein
MKKYLRYLHYVVKHRWFVFLACVKMGIIWRGLVHDLSKLSPKEFFPYARMFYGDNKPIRDSTGYYKPYDTGNEEFEYAWLNHTRHNKHHWQYWVLPFDKDDKSERHQKIFDIPEIYVKEMVCDWIGAGKAQKSKHNALEWFEANKEKLAFSSGTYGNIEKLLASLFGKD